MLSFALLSRYGPPSGANNAMNREKRMQCQGAPPSGYTLLEMLVTIAVMMIVLAIGIPSVNTLKRSYELQSSSTGLMNQLELARQTARTENRKVEVRFYVDSSMTPPVYRSLRLLLLSVDGSVASQFQKPFTLPDTISISSDSTLSSLLPLPDKTDEMGTYRGVSFLPNGTMDTTGGSLPTLTLLPNIPKVARAGELPPDFATIQIDPRTGHTKFFRP